MKRAFIKATEDLLEQVAKTEVAEMNLPALREKLLFPDEVKIVGLSFDMPNGIYHLYLRGSGLPDECDGASGLNRPELSATYSTTGRPLTRAIFDGFKVVPPLPPPRFMRRTSDGKCFWCHLDESEHSSPERNCSREPQPLIPSTKP